MCHDVPRPLEAAVRLASPIAIDSGDGPTFPADGVDCRVGFDIRFDGGIGTMEILGDIVGPIGDVADWEAAQDPEPEKKTR